MTSVLSNYNRLNITGLEFCYTGVVSSYSSSYVCIVKEDEHSSLVGTISCRQINKRK
jgi:hypothetical protein